MRQSSLKNTQYSTEYLLKRLEEDVETAFASFPKIHKSEIKNKKLFNDLLSVFADYPSVYYVWADLKKVKDSFAAMDAQSKLRSPTSGKPHYSQPILLVGGWLGELASYKNRVMDLEKPDLVEVLTGLYKILEHVPSKQVVALGLDKLLKGVEALVEIESERMPSAKSAEDLRASIHQTLENKKITSSLKTQLKKCVKFYKENTSKSQSLPQSEPPVEEEKTQEAPSMITTSTRRLIITPTPLTSLVRAQCQGMPGLVASVAGSGYSPVSEKEFNTLQALLREVKVKRQLSELCEKNDLNHQLTAIQSQLLTLPCEGLAVNIIDTLYRLSPTQWSVLVFKDYQLSYQAREAVLGQVMVAVLQKIVQSQPEKADINRIRMCYGGLERADWIEQDEREFEQLIGQYSSFRPEVSTRRPTYINVEPLVSPANKANSWAKLRGSPSPEAKRTPTNSGQARHVKRGSSTLLGSRSSDLLSPSFEPIFSPTAKTPRQRLLNKAKGYINNSLAEIINHAHPNPSYAGVYAETNGLPQLVSKEEFVALQKWLVKEKSGLNFSAEQLSNPEKIDELRGRLLLKREGLSKNILDTLFRLNRHQWLALCTSPLGFRSDRNSVLAEVMLHLWHHLTLSPLASNLKTSDFSVCYHQLDQGDVELSVAHERRFTSLVGGFIEQSHTEKALIQANLASNKGLTPAEKDSLGDKAVFDRALSLLARYPGIARVLIKDAQESAEQEQSAFPNLKAQTFGWLAEFASFKDFLGAPSQSTTLDVFLGLEQAIKWKDEEKDKAVKSLLTKMIGTVSAKLKRLEFNNKNVENADAIYTFYKTLTRQRSISASKMWGQIGDALIGSSSKERKSRLLAFFISVELTKSGAPRSMTSPSQLYQLGQMVYQLSEKRKKLFTRHKGYDPDKGKGSRSYEIQQWVSERHGPEAPGLFSPAEGNRSRLANNKASVNGPAGTVPAFEKSIDATALEQFKLARGGPLTTPQPEMKQTSPAGRSAQRSPTVKRLWNESPVAEEGGYSPIRSPAARRLQNVSSPEPAAPPSALRTPSAFDKALWPEKTTIQSPVPMSISPTAYRRLKPTDLVIPEIDELGTGRPASQTSKQPISSHRRSRTMQMSPGILSRNLSSLWSDSVETDSKAQTAPSPSVLNNRAGSK